jgi:hypothetical protein
MGRSALYDNTTGNENTATGTFALLSNTTGSFNTANGFGALQSNKTGESNVAMGNISLYNNTEGKYNTAAGDRALYNNTTGGLNIAVGGFALYHNSTAESNTAIGTNALYLTPTGEQNTAVGFSAGIFTSNPNRGTLIGANTHALENLENFTVVGNGALARASNSVVIGNGAVTSIGGAVGWTSFSDGRYKKNIKQDVPGLEFINKLHPVTYNLDVEGLDKAMHQELSKSKALKFSSQINSTSTANVSSPSNNPGPALQIANKQTSASGEVISQQVKRETKYTGFVAQDVEKAAKELNYEFSGVDAPKNDHDFYGLRYGEFVVPLVMAVQELSKKAAALASENAELKRRLDKLEILINNTTGLNINKTFLPAITAATGSVQLDQNIPNPFTHTTTISYSLPEGTQRAELMITDYNGKVIKTIGISNTGKGTINLDGSLFNNGTYSYSIILDGRIAETRKMLIMK